MWYNSANNDKILFRYDLSKKIFEKKEDMTALHYALLCERPEMALKLIDMGADVNAEDCFGLRPVHLAAMRGYSDVLGKLEDKGSKLEVFSKNMMTPAQVAKENNHNHLEHFFMEPKDVRDARLVSYISACCAV